MLTEAEVTLIETYLLQMAPDAMLVVDQSGQILHVNALAEDLFGYPPGTLAGEPLDILIPERVRDLHHQHIADYFRDPHQRLLDVGPLFRGRRRDGGEFAAQISLSPFQTPQGTHVVAAIRDVSEYRRIQQTLEQTAVDLEQQVAAHGVELLQANAELRQRIAEQARTEAALREAEGLYRQLVENQPDLICRFLPDTTLTFVNTAYARFFGCQPEALIDKPFLEFLGAEEQANVLAQLAALTPAAPARQYEHETLRADGVPYWHLWHDFAFFDPQGKVTHFQSVGVDITARKQIETQLQITNRALQLRSACNQALIHATDETGLVNEICRLVVEVGGYRLAWVGLAEQDEAKTVRPAGQAGYETGYLESAQITWADNERGQGPTGTAIRTGSPVVARDLLTEPHYLPWRAEALRRGYAASLALPLRLEGQIFGALNIYAAESIAFVAKEIQLLTDLADDVAYGLAALRLRAQRKEAEEALRKSEERLTMALRAAHAGAWERNVATNQAIWSDDNYRVLGLVPGSVQACYKNWLRCIHPDDRAAVEPQVAEAREQGRELNIEFRVVWPDGGIHWINSIGKMQYDPAGQPVGMYGIQMDITERKHAEEALFAEKERVQITLHSIGDAVITTDAQAKVEYLNPVAEAFTGWPVAEARGRPLQEIFRIVNEQSREPAPDPVARCLQEGRIVGLANHTVLIGRDGQEYDIDDSAAPIRGRDGQVLGVVLVFHDVTETRRLTRQLAHDASHDALTGLVNRTEFERRLERALASAQQYDAHHALCYLDLDQFKVVNDTAGHAAGDQLLRQINAILSGMFRERDTLARIGGDEFGLLLDNCPLDRAQLIAQTVVSNIRDHRFHWEGRTYQIGASIGLVPISAATQDTNQLLTQADVACYIAKELGRNRVHLYQQEDSETAQHHSEILGAAGLRDALEQGRFRLQYQPIVSLNLPDSPPVRYEVLLRVAYKSSPDEASELVLPAAFIPAAERYGLMGAIDRWVIQTAFREYANGIGQTGAKIAINLSGNSLSDETLLAFIEAQFAEYGFPPERVCFEITETAAIQNLRRALELMAALKRHGCQLALDDFGSGLSSFHYLKTLPVNYLKIDGSFVKDMLENASDCALVAAINQMSHTLGIETVAEYAHSQGIVERLRELGVDYAQGFFIGQPAPWSPPS